MAGTSWPLKGGLMWLNIKTGYTFKQVYGPLDKVAEKCKELCDKYKMPRPYGGIADIGNTFAHIPWSKACKSAGIKPIYGVVLPVTEDLQREVRRYPFNLMTFIAKNICGLKEIYDLVELSYDQFYYRQRITYEQVNKLSKEVIVTSGISPNYPLIKREVLKEIGPQTPLSIKKKLEYQNDLIPVIDNYYPNAEDDLIYEPFADERLRERRTYPIHILSFDEWCNESKFFSFLLPRLQWIADSCDVQLLTAPMVKYNGEDDIEKWCIEGAKKRRIDLISDGDYKKRYNREMLLIKEKDYIDYFLVVADAIRFAKTKMAVGPARGSAAGSLVCYLMGITEVDPLVYDLYFERFIDVNRFDLPDIDIDFQRNKRHLVVKYLEKKYGKHNVVQIGNINRMKPKSAITRYAQALGIPVDEVIELKDAIMERSGGDARANDCIEDTFKDTEVGKKFIENYPNMEVVKHIEAHPSHTGVHAAGILVCNHPITNYCGVNSRDNKRIGMLDKKDAEVVNLLKIDALGLRTLDIIADVCDSINKPYEWMYEIPVNDKSTFDIFNNHRFNGIFQFEGSAVQSLAKSMPIESMEDIAALGALGRPGPLVSGGATSFLEYRNNPNNIKYLSNHPVVIEATENTYGIIIYQEQMLAIGRNYGKLSWKDTGDLRKAASKSLGDEFFDKFKVKFLEGAKSIGEKEENALKVWKAMHTFGSWSFNKSHAISYAIISYICAYLKAHYPMEFLVANLKNSKDEKSALKILRDAVENDGIKYVFFDEENSEADWAVKDDILYGGFVNLFGIGKIMAKKAVDFRNKNKQYPPGLMKKIEQKISPFKYLYPAKEIYGDFYTDPYKHQIYRQVSHICNVVDDGEYVIIGCLIRKNLRDANEACFVNKRGGKFLKGNTAWLNITIEDDTGSIMCKIKNEDYETFGREIAETGKENKDWYAVYGKKINGWSILFVINIMRITR